MASLLQLECRDCGFFKDNVRFGPTFLDHRNIGPALKVSTGEIVEVDYNEPPKDTNVIPYTAAGLRRAPEGKAADLEECWPYELWCSYNFFPQCNAYTLGLSTHALID